MTTTKNITIHNPLPPYVIQGYVAVPSWWGVMDIHILILQQNEARSKLH